MDTILKLSESSNVATAATAREIDSEQFSIFIQKKPIWEFYSLTQDNYIAKSNHEKIPLIHSYYKAMMEGKIYFVLKYRSV